MNNHSEFSGVINNFKKCNLKVARKLLENTKNDSSFYYNKNRYILEWQEMNFARAREYLGECMKSSNNQQRDLFDLAQLNIETGDFEEAEYMFKTLQLDNRTYLKATFKLIQLYFIRFDFYKAYLLLQAIESGKLPDSYIEIYNTLNFYIRYYLGKVTSDEARKCPKRNYLMYKLIHPGNEIIIDHIKMGHSSKYYGETGFLRFLDLNELLENIKKEIPNRNGLYSNFSEKFRFTHDEPIGYLDGEETRDLCVVTTPGTNDIITLYPALWSSDYDIEKNVESKELKFKRIRGVFRQ